MQGNRKVIRLGLAGLSAAAFLVVAAANASAASFMKIDGVPGEAKDHKHEGWIEILAVNWSGSRGGGPRRGGGGSLTMSKQSDASSPHLLRYNSTGKQFPKITIDWARPDRGAEMQRYELYNVMISSYESGGSAGSLPTETISLNYQKIRFVPTPMKR